MHKKSIYDIGIRTLAQNPEAQLDKHTNFVRTEAQQIGGLGSKFQQDKSTTAKHRSRVFLVRLLHK